MLDRILEAYEAPLLKADGFDKAVIGIEENSMRLIYSVKKCLEILCETMTEEEAIEYFEFNVINAYVGEHTPIWCKDFF